MPERTAPESDSLVRACACMQEGPPADEGAVSAFGSSLEHLCAELERVDLLVRVQALRARQVAGDDPLRGLTISEDDIEALFRRPLGMPHWSAAPEAPELLELEHEIARRSQEISARCAASLRRGTPLRLCALAERFELTRLDLDVLLLGLAPELDARYDRLFAYLHDDVTRKRPSVDMALGLLCATFEERLAARARFSPSAPLLRHGLLQLFAEPPGSQPTLLGSTLKVDGHLVEWLLGSDELDARLAAHARVVVPRAGHERAPLPAALAARAAQQRADGEILYLQGPPGSGRQSTAEALCAALGKRLLVLDGASLSPLADSAAEPLVRLWLREARLLAAVPLWRDFGAAREPGQPERAALLRALEEHRGLVLLSGEDPWEPAGPLRARPFLLVTLEHPSPHERARLWREALAQPAQSASTLEELARLASRARMTAGQIRTAAATARSLAEARDPAHGRITPADVAQACRLHAPRPASQLARRLSSPHRWEDLVLPEGQIAHLREICDHIRYRERVHDEWGFDRRLSTGKGLSILFTGPPGTGKTMTAGVMARDLGLELFQIDLSSVVSKYIGETEKHLARLFAEAEGSGAVLFFDEADALFGKRTEVKDSHDRYANLETSYLLQRIEAYEGMVILASNFKRNMDEAFLRRFHFIMEYSIPDERQRRRLWEQIWPPGVPRAPDLDLGLMAKRFDLSGGHIRNIALAASFLAAARGAPVTMADLLHATRREYQKLSRRVDEALLRP